MKHKDAEALFIDLLEARLEAPAAAELNRHLADCTQCSESLKQYRAIIALVETLRTRTAGISPDFSAGLEQRLLTKISAQPSTGRRHFTRRILWPASTLIAASLAIVIASDQEDYGKALLKHLLLETASNTAQEPSATTAAPAPAPTVEILRATQDIEEGARLENFMFEVQSVPADRVPEGVLLARDKGLIVGKFAKTTLDADRPLTTATVTDVRPLSALNIPPGFRSVTIRVDEPRSGVEGFARPNSRVDVLWSYKDRNGENSVATISRFLKVLSVDGTTDEPGRPSDGAITATLLVADRDAKKIELAQRLGSLSLTLVGQEEPDKLAGEIPEPVDIDSIIGKQPEEVQDGASNVGIMYTTDNRTGKQQRYVLRSGRWKADNDAKSASSEDPGAAQKTPATEGSAETVAKSEQVPAPVLYVLRTVEVDSSEARKEFVRPRSFVKLTFTGPSSDEPVVIAERGELISIGTNPGSNRIKIVLRLNQNEADELDKRREGRFTLLAPGS